MIKPVIFFSHSSRDSEVLEKIKSKLLHLTKNTINVFLSSDGQSIPFGKNWVHALENALDSTSVMFVVVTPSSIFSNWIYFEAGYSYSKNVKVIPVGMFGVDLNNITPPLSLLQGFNIDSQHGLNNIIAIINQEFKTSYSEGFSEGDFSEVISNKIEDQDLSIVNNYFDQIITKIDGRYLMEEVDNSRLISQEMVEQIYGYLISNSKEYSRIRDSISTYGMTMKSKEYPRGIKLEMFIDPLSYKANFNIIKGMLELMEEKNKEWIGFYIDFNIGVKYETKFFKVASKVEKTKAKLLSKNEWIEYSFCQFKVVKKKYTNRDEAEHQLLVRINKKSIAKFNLQKLCKFLVENNIIWKT